MSSTLDYRDLISMAEAKSKDRQREIERKCLDAAKAKRVDPKQVKLKLGVQKFLAKKEEEEKKRKHEALIKKRQLLEIRNQDSKARGRVKRMLQMTKSSNKSCIKDEDGNIIEMEQNPEQVGEIQPDEDDYGYTSTFASEMHKKMLQKYQAEPKPSPFSKNTVTVKPPVAQSLHPQRGHNRVSHTKQQPEAAITPQKGKIIEPAKIKKKVAPPPGFNDLLRLAEEKCKEPVKIKKPVKEVADGLTSFEFGRPMTAKEKARYLSEQALKKRVEIAMAERGNPVKDVQKAVGSTIPPKPVDAKPKLTVPKFKESPSITKFPDSKQAPPSTSIQRNTPISANDQNRLPSTQGSSKAMSGAHLQAGQTATRKPVSSQNISYNRQDVQSSKYLSDNKPTPSSSQRRPNEVSYTPASKLDPRMTGAPNGRVGMGPPLSKSQQQLSKPNQTVPQSGRSMPPISRNVPPSSRNVPSSHYQPRKRPLEKDESRSAYGMSQGRMESRPSYKGRPVIYSDEDEYDSEMDDFIDDDDVQGQSLVSQEISKIFGYNKRKYADEDSDDECMETSVSQQWREEQRSLRIGIKEDLEDIRREEEEKKRKAAFLRKRR